MSELKRYPVKYLRDGIKVHYPPKVACKICGTTENLHFHHFKSLAELYKAWIGVEPTTVLEMEDVKERFYLEFWSELVEEGVCLCQTHHEKLHKVYGKNPKLSTAEKQKRWVEKIRVKYNS